LKKQRKQCEINGSAQLIGLINKSVVAGQREHEESWLLLLDLLQREADQAAFEDLAVDYAVTFEVSPPSWEQPSARPVQPAARQASGEAAASAFALRGELVAAGAEAFGDLITFANDKSEVPIDASRLLRIDFVSAGQLLNAVSRLQMAGKHVLIYGVSHLVMSLFEIIGIGQMAEIRLRRA
jgi:anti-anti-sigma regulatory factor